MLSTRELTEIQAAIAEPLTHRLLIAHLDPATTPDATGQLFVDATGQPVGDATIDGPSDLTDWAAAAEVRAFVEERSATWPDGPGAGPELVDTRIWVEAGADVRELDKMKWIDAGQAYQAVFVHQRSITGGAAYTPGLIEVEARRIPL